MIIFPPEVEYGQFVYDNTSDTSPLIGIIVGNALLRLDFRWLIDSQFQAGNLGSESNLVKKELGLGIYSKAPCGGFVNLFKLISSLECNFIIYSGVNEISNSHYIITVHKIFKVALNR